MITNFGVNKMSNEKLFDIIEKNGLRPTIQRIAVYKYLIENPVHPTADTIYKAVRSIHPNFSRTTVYNSLFALSEKKLIRVINIDSSERRFDGNPCDHGHFICEKCGGISDFQIEPDTVSHIIPSGCISRLTDIYIAGLCSECKFEK